jgi:hypothetical protein
MPFSFRALIFAIAAFALLSLSCVVDTVSGASSQQSSSAPATAAKSTANVYCTPSGSWIGPSTDGPAKMPFECMYTALEGTPSPGRVRGPHSTTPQVQADINAAECGDRVLVAAGSTLGPIALPAKKCDSKHWITIASTGVNSPDFPQEGNRMTPCWSGVGSMPNRPTYPCPKPELLTFKIVTPNSRNGITSESGDHYRIIGAEITRVPTGGAMIYNLVDLTSNRIQTNHIIFDRDWFHGINQDGNFPIRKQSDDTSTTRAVYLGQSNHVAIIDSYFSDFYDTGSMSANGNTDAQCIGGGVGSIPNSGWGVYKFVNNHCEASAEGILLGGAGGPPLTPAGCTIMVNCNLDTPSDIEVRENYFFKPLSWNGNTTAPVTVGWPVVKNGFEMKTGARAVFEGNVIENCWYSAQVCYSFSIAPINQQSGGPAPTATCPSCIVQDFTYRYNYSYNVAYGIGLYAFLPAHCSTCQPQGGNRISIHDNLIGDNLNLGNLRLQSTGDGMELYASRDTTGRGLTQLNHIDISHNTFVRAVRSLAGFGADAPGQMHDWTIQNNIFPYGNYGVGPIGNGNGCDKRVAWGSNDFLGLLKACVTNWKVAQNAVFNWQSGSWPSDNRFYKNPGQIKFVDYHGGNSGFNPGNYALQPSSPLHNAGSDGKDVGADIGTLLSKIAGVRR